MHINLRMERVCEQTALLRVQRKTGFVARTFDAKNEHGGAKNKKAGRQYSSADSAARTIAQAALRLLAESDGGHATRHRLP
jgi:hypothetical protein